MYRLWGVCVDVSHGRDALERQDKEGGALLSARLSGVLSLSAVLSRGRDCDRGRENHSSDHGVGVMMKGRMILTFIALFLLAPLAWVFAQDVPVQSQLHGVVLISSIAAFGLMLGVGWLSRLIPASNVQMPLFKRLVWHRWIGSVVGLLLLLHPFAVVGHRCWAGGFPFMDNLLMLLRAPLMLSGWLAWLALLILLVSSWTRSLFHAKTFRMMHGGLSLILLVLSVWHIATVGRHSSWLMTGWWIVLLAGLAGALLSRVLKEKVAK